MKKNFKKNFEKNNVLNVNKCTNSLFYSDFIPIFVPMKSYFTIQELVASDIAKKFNIDNTPSLEVKQHLKELISSVLNPIREAWGGPVLVRSGYRCKELNEKLGGSKTSAHLIGYAADLVPGNGRRIAFIKFVQDFLSSNNIPFDQCIDEYGRWCHIGLKNMSNKQRKQIFKIR